MGAYCSHLNIDILDTKEFMKIFDEDNDGMVSEVEFVKGCQRLQGSAKPADLLKIFSQIQDLHQDLRHFQQQLQLSPWEPTFSKSETGSRSYAGTGREAA